MRQLLFTLITCHCGLPSTQCWSFLAEVDNDRDPLFFCQNPQSRRRRVEPRCCRHTARGAAVIGEGGSGLDSQKHKNGEKSAGLTASSLEHSLQCAIIKLSGNSPH